MKTLYLDIETAPNLGWFWQLKNQYISPNQIQNASEMLSFAAKWKDEKFVFFNSVMDVGKEEMLLLAHELISEADVLVTYYGSGFDEPTLNREFALSGMTAPAPGFHLDLYREVKRKFMFPSYKLDYVLKAFGHKGKVKHEGFDLWLKFMAGDEKAYQQMKKYNSGDVTSLEWLDKRLGSWVRRPNLNLFGAEGCPSCGSTKVQKRGLSRTSLGTFQRYWCSACGGWSRSGKRIEGIDLR
jgi:DNA polymerase elongation subunit (family B)